MVEKTEIATYMPLALKTKITGLRNTVTIVTLPSRLTEEPMKPQHYEIPGGMRAYCVLCLENSFGWIFIKITLYTFNSSKLKVTLKSLQSSYSLIYLLLKMFRLKSCFLSPWDHSKNLIWVK